MPEPHPTRWRAVFLPIIVSLVLLAPCWWHARIEAGDVASHTYNAWLANHVSRLHGLFLVRQGTNVLYDFLLAHLCRWLGYALGEKLAVSLVALLFFWGMFALASLRAWKWHIAPVVAMLTYSWTFHMGLMNFCLSAGLSCLALAMWIRRGVRGSAIAVPLLVLAWLAHLLPVLIVAACGAYALIHQRLRSQQRLLLLLSGLAILLLARQVLVTRFTTMMPPLSAAILLGVNQFVIYTLSPYRIIGFAIVIVLWATIVVCHRRRLRELLLSAPLQLALLFVAATATLPTALGGVGSGVSFVVERLSLAIPLCGCVLLAEVRPPRWVKAIIWIPALAFFAVLWGQSRVMNRIDAGISAAAQLAPADSRVVLLMPYGDNTSTIGHMVDRACIGHCFSYANYEASTRQFRLRATPANGIVADNYSASFAMQLGRYVVQPQDAPLYEIYLCDRDSDRFCVRELQAGDRLAR